MSRLVSIVLLFISCSIYAQDTLQRKQRLFFKNIYFVNEFSQNIEHSRGISNIRNKEGLAFNYKQFKVESSFDLFKIISDENTLIQTSAAINVLHPFKKNNKWSLFLGTSHTYYYTRKWNVTYEGKGFDGFVNYYYGIKLKPSHKNYHLLSIDLQLLYWRIALAYSYAHNASLLHNISLSEGMSRFCMSYYQPLFSTKETQTIINNPFPKTNNNLYISLGLSSYLISHYEITASQGARPPYRPRTDENKTFIRLPNAKIGIAYFHNNFLQQVNVNGPFMLTAEYSLSYNLQPLFNNYKPSFTGLDVGFHIDYFSLLDVERDVKTSLYSNMHLGLFHITKKRLYYGIYNYSLLPNIYQTDYLAEYLRVNIELRLGYFLSIYKK